MVGLNEACGKCKCSSQRLCKHLQFAKVKKRTNVRLECYGYKDTFGSTLSLKHGWSALWVNGTALHAWADNKKILILPAIQGWRQLKANAMREFNLNFSQCKQKSAHWGTYIHREPHKATDQWAQLPSLVAFLPQPHMTWTFLYIPQTKTQIQVGCIRL